MNTREAARHAGNARDVMVTGMGFCLPGIHEPVRTAAELWDIASRGATCLARDEVYFGSVNLTPAMFEERLPDIPEFFSRHYTAAHRFGLMAMAEACADGQLNYRAGDLEEAAILVGRGSVDTNIDSYLSVLGADPDAVGGLAAMDLFVSAEQAMTPSDVALVQSALARSTGPCFTVSCGCASSAVQIGNARRMIAHGEVDLAVVTGVDVFNLRLLQNIQRLLHDTQAAYDTVRADVARADAVPDAEGMPDLVPSFESLMRPYDRRASSINHGEGAATVILESREHAERRGAYTYGQVLATALTRDGLGNPLAADESGAELVTAVRRCLGDRWRIEQIPYIHGGSDGNVVVTAFEANAVRELYGDGVEPLMTSQEGCFGHNGAPSGCLGVALTTLMLERGEVCPTANCEQPVEGLPFDPVPGVHSRRLDFDYALNFNYQVGGAKHVVLLGRPDAV
ncbi:beta-ketoacyl synthase N-terminal-like domain-containing protein [Streptomyces sp. SAJ15]|uniref:beta-ketoacyl synthase N-terminal-like domain-containing protein n=1 Tax=Streptomyces sp. SAJ15 TaxID=2011095 RepID=UPI0011859086|nr:beta-ketoacyl synthase N-terminal-like domain-containing protein [Streptomyces sp. SAJ15]TVL91540.1 ketoacyl synthase [Streptomyces sp. SAJ15]